MFTIIVYYKHYRYTEGDRFYYLIFPILPLFHYEIKIFFNFC